MDDQEPVVVAPGPAAAKSGPWSFFQLRILMPVFLALAIVVVLLVHFVGLAFSPAKESPQEKAARKIAQQYEQTTPASPSDVAGFTSQTTRTATDIGKETAGASALSRLAGQALNAGFSDSAANPLAVPGNPLNSDARVYKAWADADAATRQGGLSAPGTPYGQPPATGRSGVAMASPAEEKREAARKREQQRLAASSIAIDFTKQQSTEITQNMDPAPHEGAVEAQSVGQVPTPVPATAVDSKEPKVLQSHTCTDLCEGDLIETVLTNRINGSQAGFADAMVTKPVYSHNWDPKGRRLLIPVGSRVLGNVTAVNGSQAQRLFVAFHKLRRPDGSTFLLDNFTGLDMAGSAGLRDLVNHHYLQTFGMAGAIAAIGAVSQVGNSSTGFGYDPSVSIRNGFSQGLGQESMQVLNQFLSQPPTMTVREGKNLVKVYIAQDLELPEYAPKELAYAR
ncbi:MAG: hypothetical protein M3Y72_01920 [Acidobacteriota bacterium]|nr:hypothetical protein [Acidobacteriota bacterium]